jgi:membrane protein
MAGNPDRPAGHPPHLQEAKNMIAQSKALLVTLNDRISRNNTSLLAAAIAFYAFTSIPSTLTAVVSLYELAFDPHDIESHVTALAGLLPQDVVGLVASFLQFLATKPSAQLGTGLVLGLAIALWSIQSATAAMITALNVVNGCTPTRGFFRSQLLAFVMGIGIIGFVVLSLVLMSAVPAVLASLPIPAAGLAVIPAIRWPVLIAATAMAIAGIYRFAPERWPGRQRNWWGILLGTFCCLLGSYLFSAYVGAWASYDQSYGSLGAVLIFVMWLYLTSFSVLLGAELNATLNEMVHRAWREGNKSAG